MTSATHLVGTRWEHIARRSVENIAGCPMPGWNLCAASSIVMEIDSGQPMPNGNQPMMWLVLNGTITSMVTIKGKSHIASYMQVDGEFVYDGFVGAGGRRHEDALAFLQGPAGAHLEVVEGEVVAGREDKTA